MQAAALTRRPHPPTGRDLTVPVVVYTQWSGRAATFEHSSFLEAVFPLILLAEVPTLVAGAHLLHFLRVTATSTLTSAPNKL
jgi:hypothetical protein